MKQHLMSIVWPAFLVAGVLEMLVFAFVDPEALHGFGGEQLDLSGSAVYSLAFFLFWAAAIVSSSLTAWLEASRRR